MKINYVNISTNNPRDTITIRGLRENNVTVSEITDNSSGWKKLNQIRKKVLSQNNDYDLTIVGYTGNILVPWLWLISKRPIVYNALASFYESIIISRQAGKKISLSSFKYWFIDWLAFNLSGVILVESENQKNFISKTFHISPNKIIVHLTGVDDHLFFFNPNIKKSGRFTVLFRGKFLPEAGTDIVLKAAKLLEGQNIFFRIIGNGFLKKEILQLVDNLKPKNVELITDYLPSEQLRSQMLECHLALGQMADHPRLKNTIPHKAFESLPMKLPYLTGRQPAILEILTENETCFCCNPGDPKDLAKKILELSKKTDSLNAIKERAFALFQTNMTPKILGQKLLKTLELVRLN